MSHFVGQCYAYGDVDFSRKVIVSCGDSEMPSSSACARQTVDESRNRRSNHAQGQLICPIRLSVLHASTRMMDAVNMQFRLEPISQSSCNHSDNGAINVSATLPHPQQHHPNGWATRRECSSAATHDGASHPLEWAPRHSLAPSWPW